MSRIGYTRGLVAAALMAVGLSGVANRVSTVTPNAVRPHVPTQGERAPARSAGAAAQFEVQAIASAPTLGWRGGSSVIPPWVYSKRVPLRNNRRGGSSVIPPWVYSKRVPLRNNRRMHR